MTSRIAKLLFFVLLALCVVFASLALARRRSAQSVKFSDDDLKDLTVILERTTCYGSCPAYKLTIHGDGRVEYEGGNNVKEKNKKEGRIAPDELKKLVTEFEKAKYFSLAQYNADKCSGTYCTDLPTAITEFRSKEKTYRVEHDLGCRSAPKELWELEASIDRVTNAAQWTGDVSKQGPFGSTCFNR